MVFLHLLAVECVRMSSNLISLPDLCIELSTAEPFYVSASHLVGIRIVGVSQRLAQITNSCKSLFFYSLILTSINVLDMCCQVKYSFRDLIVNIAITFSIQFSSNMSHVSGSQFKAHCYSLWHVRNIEDGRWKTKKIITRNEHFHLPFATLRRVLSSLFPWVSSEMWKL